MWQPNYLHCRLFASPRLSFSLKRVSHHPNIPNQPRSYISGCNERRVWPSLYLSTRFVAMWHENEWSQLNFALAIFELVFITAVLRTFLWIGGRLISWWIVITYSIAYSFYCNDCFTHVISANTYKVTAIACDFAFEFNRSHNRIVFIDRFTSIMFWSVGS